MTKKRSIVRVAHRDVALSNLDKVMYPEVRFTKGQVIEYYTRVARYLLPHLKNRPITMKRFPNGVDGEYFYEKDAPSFTPEWVKTYSIPRTSEKSVIDYILINDLPTLVWSANMANLEIHPFLAKAPNVDVPTMVVFDLDPGEEANILKSCEVAFLVKPLLDQLKLKSLAKVSGSKGIHLHVPLNTKVTYEMTQSFARSIAQFLEREHPDLIVAEMAKVKRKGKVFIDWSQNSVHKSTVAVYSLRAKRGKPFVAMPVTWHELDEAVKKSDSSALFFEPATALRKLEERGDLFAAELKLKQKLPKPFLELDPDKEERRSDPEALETYRQKRNFSKTPEPPPLRPRPSRQGSRRLFVIQKHAASHLHYDFRLEIGGTLKSWAVPKGPPYDLNERRLAMATEDHPMEYARFEGIIPKGEYGGGTVMVWDTGTYELIDGNYWKGKLHIALNGKKLKGEWVLVKGQEQNGKENIWYLFKTATNIPRFTAKKENSSALTGRSLEQIAKAEDAVWHSARASSKKPSAARRTIVDLESLPEERVRFVKPMLSDSVTKLPAGDQWVYEMEFNGYRCLAGKKQNRVTLRSRRQTPLTKKFPDIAQALKQLKPDSLIDGEIVALDEKGRPSFELLQHHRSKASAICYYAFDLIIYRGKSLLKVPLQTRRELLVETLADITNGGDSVRLSEPFKDNPKTLILAAKDLGFEGIIAKRENSNYVPGTRSDDWLKYEFNQNQES